ncbi:hypothetical protein OUZ56_007582 [Daphnia magna]|uniref:Uncharacterized protein n=1 Tax=Daphnia magna TaxID=35525 RepID=A0ABR0AAD3_9CRUS|nr:hypothetical protein OUZ56_007582 [Daphnia magna]
MLRCLKMLKHLSEATIFTELIIELYNCEIYVTLPVVETTLTFHIIIYRFQIRWSQLLAE